MDFSCKIGLPGSARPGLIQLVAGNGDGDASGDGGLASKAGLPFPFGLAARVDEMTLYISSGDQVRMVNLRMMLLEEPLSKDVKSPRRTPLLQATSQQDDPATNLNMEFLFQGE